ncbi:MAG: hypothetical protein A3B10_01860 [Candidatus Doudnabacteria bacterium RIFCSPLOWO2_01_FULL_44_21]|uniref:Uncharacterized protein n=1 Tax=Candidatus Doudnabacteria bacterium RIFCSPLOWO2_01_FULL_44_21 TaxID=1817841 RepID=A0A1F5Q2K5_9BACT|nr:MAG: hypothetical protein A3B95_01745 [Candidatus Doudnabacteria bacterium RIFCSPHIGHO2_02_FULL_43_13b]OGE96409.1 MAG: hypothetical protein A3B10_01860 [Candidatus Doudnabacteria bacterium RIFCSPLOWO2_01_FULL_44_21]
MLIRYESVPCWYEISWSADPLGLIIRLHKDSAEEFFSKFESWPVTGHLCKRYGFKSFQANPEQGFGFDGLGLVALQSTADFLSFLLALPQIQVLTNKPCRYCQGRKKDSFGNNCLGCDKTGKETRFDWQSVLAAGLSLSLFLTKASIVQKKTSSSWQQLMTLETGHLKDRDMHSAPLGGECSSCLVRWISTADESCGPKIIKTMKRAYGRMLLGSDDVFRADIRPEGRFSLSCPGDCACIHTDSENRFEEGIGYSFSSHNVDHLGQQLALIAGLASLCDQARASGTL